jgi:hypothetical protein
MTGTINLIAILYFLEEALGFRVSLHWLRRFLETQEASDLERLVVNVAREHLVDYDTWSNLVADNYKLVDDPQQSKVELQEKLDGSTLLDVLDDPNSLAQAADMYFSHQGWIVNRLLQATGSSPDINWKDALSRNQVKSKIWLLETMSQQGWLTDQTKMILVGGWVGLLPALANLRQHRFKSAVNFDLDPDVHFAARLLNTGPFYSFQSQQKDIRQVDLTEYADHIIVDTIVEHFSDHKSWVQSLSPGTQVILQGNDMFDVPDHVNCHSSLEEFVDDSGLDSIVWQGQLDLPGCSRFMIMGKV